MSPIQESANIILFISKSEYLKTGTFYNFRDIYLHYKTVYIDRPVIGLNAIDIMNQ